MSATTITTAKQKRRRITSGVLVTSTNTKRRNTIMFLERMDIKVVRYFKAISYTGIGYALINS